jgi:hypothetical protein
LNGKGSIEINEATVRESKLVSGISQLASYNFGSEVISMKDVKLAASIEDGRSYVQPFELSIGDHKATVSGSLGVDGTLNYVLKTDLKAGALGQQLNSIIAGIKGRDSDKATDVIPVAFRITGKYDNPSIALTSISGDQSIRAEAGEALEEGSETVKEETVKEINKGLENLVQGDTAALRQQADSLKESIDNLEKSGEEIKNLIQNLFKKSKKENGGQ